MSDLRAAGGVAPERARARDEDGAWAGGRASGADQSFDPAAQRAAIKERFVAEHGDWTEVWEDMLTLDSAFVAAYLDLALVPIRKDRLGAKLRALIGVAVNAAVTQLHQEGIRTQLRRAMEHGATAAEVMEVVALVSALGIHAVNVGLPLIAEVLRERGQRVAPAEPGADRERIKNDFVARRGHWSAFWQEVLDLDPELLEAYTAFSSRPAASNALEAKDRELICLAFNASTTHLYAPSIKLHLERALDLGAHPAEVLEVLDIVSAVGIASAVTTVPLLVQELAARQEWPPR